MCAGWQSGKTVTLPHWLKREIQRCGPGDFGAFSSTYKLLSRKFLPELKRCFANPKRPETNLAIFRVVDQQFVFTDEGNRRIHGPDWNGEPTIIQLGHAENPDSLESATMKAVVWDECGQRLVPKASYETVVSRLMVHRGRLLMASKPYEINWFRDIVVSPDKDTEVIEYASWENPENPPADDEYWNVRRRKMQHWRFDMVYGGKFTKPAGLIYDSFTDHNKIKAFPILSVYPRAILHPGMDFGGINTAGVAVADIPETGEIIVYGEYWPGEAKTFPQHVAGMRALNAPYTGGRAFSVGCGGNKNGEEGWREGFRMNGLPLMQPPDQNVDVQIQIVWALLADNKLKFFEETCEGTIGQLQLYSRKVDQDGNVTTQIDNDAAFHYLAALRYICSYLRPNYAAAGKPASIPAVVPTMPNIARAPVQVPYAGPSKQPVKPVLHRAPGVARMPAVRGPYSR